MSTPLYTVGYEGRSLDDVLQALTAARVRRLIDVRELPLSRRRGFSKTALSEALAAVGIEYVHVRPLGNPKENRDRSVIVDALRELRPELPIGHL